MGSPPSIQQRVHVKTGAFASNVGSLDHLVGAGERTLIIGWRNVAVRLAPLGSYIIGRLALRSSP